MSHVYTDGILPVNMCGMLPMSMISGEMLPFETNT